MYYYKSSAEHCAGTTGSVPSYTSQIQSIFQLLSSLIDFIVKVTHDGFLSPGSFVEIGLSFFFRMAGSNVHHHLQVAALGSQPAGNEFLGVVAVLQEELAAQFRLVDLINQIMNLENNWVEKEKRVTTVFKRDQHKPPAVTNLKKSMLMREINQ